MSVASRWASWLKSEKDLLSQRDTKAADVAAWEKKRPTSIDPADFVAWSTKLDTLKRQLAGIDSALEIAAGHAEAARVKAADEELKELNKAEDKRAASDEKLAIKTVEQIYEVAASLELLKQGRERTAAVNARCRGKFPHIRDGETRAREIPAKTIPATFRDEVVWEGPNGERPMKYRTDSKGELVPAGLSEFKRKTIKVCQQQERHELAHMPTRLADAITLVGLKGERIWPPA